MAEFKKPNILEFIEDMMEQGYSEDIAAAEWFALYDPDNYEPNED